jgi:serine/threonine-protein kinase
MNTQDYSNQVIDGRYRIHKKLGEGGMGAVYLARHTVVGKKVAVKFLHSEFAGNQDVVRRFYREAQTAAAIEHKNIIDVLDVGISDSGEAYLVMEYLEGESLSALLARTAPIDLAAACAILEPTLLGDLRR